MPKIAPRTPVINIRLTEGDQEKLDAICKVEKRSRPEVVRRAVTDYLDRLEREQIDARETKLERRIKKMEDRIAGLLARGNIDVGVILAIMRNNMPAATRDEDIKKAHRTSVMRLRKKLETEGEGLKELYQAEIAAKADEGNGGEGPAKPEAAG